MLLASKVGTNEHSVVYRTSTNKLKQIFRSDNWDIVFWMPFFNGLIDAQERNAMGTTSRIRVGVEKDLHYLSIPTTIFARINLDEVVTCTTIVARRSNTAHLR